MNSNLIDQKVYKKPQKPKVHLNWTKIFGSLLILVTFIVVGYIFYPWINYYAQKYLLGKQEASVVEVRGNRNTKQNKQEIYFKIETSNVKIVAPIVEGVGTNDLKKGLGHHPQTPWPDEKKGNVIIAGHSSDIDPNNNYGQIFRDLNKVEIGNRVLIAYPDNEYVYRVISRYEISPSDTSLFGQDAGPRLTFYTCSPVFTNWRRLVFVASLEKIKTDNK